MKGLRDPVLRRDPLVAQVASVIAGHRQDLRGDRRGENLDLFQGEANLGPGPLAEQVSCKLPDLVSFEHTVSDRLALLKAEEAGRLGGPAGHGRCEHDQTEACQKCEVGAW